MSDDGPARLAAVRLSLTNLRARKDVAADDELLALRRMARAAIDRLDDEPEFDLAHETLDEVGAYVRIAKPHLCVLKEDGEDFMQDCPVDLGHMRLGLSVGVEIEESHCSICKQDPWTCDHIPGADYEGERATRVITKAKFFEASIVDRPDFPDARFVSRPVSRTEVETLLGGPLPVGGKPLCDRCLTPCKGITHPPRLTH